jgi:hypothetical protein
MFAPIQSSGKSIARTSLAFYIRDESRAVIASSSSCRSRSGKRLRRGEVVWSHACQSGRDAGLAGSIGAPASVLLHRGETTWQQRRNVVANPRLRRPHAVGVPRPAALRPGRARVRVREKRRPVPRLARNGARPLLGKPNGKAGDIAGFFAFARLTWNSARLPTARFSRLERDIPSRPSAPRGRIRSSPPDNNSGSPLSRRSLPLE